MTDKEIKERALNLEKFYRTFYFDNCDDWSKLFDKPIRIESHVKGKGRNIKIIELDDNYYGIIMSKIIPKDDVSENDYISHNIILIKKLDDKDEYKIELRNVSTSKKTKKEKILYDITYNIQGFNILYRDTYIENIYSDTDFLEPTTKLLYRYFAEINK